MFLLRFFSEFLRNVIHGCLFSQGMIVIEEIFEITSFSILHTMLKSTFLRFNISYQMRDSNLLNLDWKCYLLVKFGFRVFLRCTFMIFLLFYAESWLINTQWIQKLLDILTVQPKLINIRGYDLGTMEI